MKRKAVIEKTIDMVSVVRDIAKRENDAELLSWTEGVSQALKWIIDNTDNRNVSTCRCNLLQEAEVIREMAKMDWSD